MMAAALAASGTLAMAGACDACSGSVTPLEPARAEHPPSGYEGEIARQRAHKDEFFRADPQSPLPEPVKGSFKGLDYFPVDFDYRFTGRLAVYSDPRKTTIAGSRGEQRVALRWAAFSFVNQGRTHTLQIYKLYDKDAPEGRFFLPFADETTGRQTYPAGRYVDPEIDAGGRAIVDFNLAYYPYCAYGKDYDCPLTPAENRLGVPILAGEKGWIAGPAP